MRAVFCLRALFPLLYMATCIAACEVQEASVRNDALLIAAEKGDTRSLKEALAAGANPNVTNAKGRSAMEIVSYGGRIYDTAGSLDEVKARLDEMRMHAGFR